VLGRSTFPPSTKQLNETIEPDTEVIAYPDKNSHARSGFVEQANTMRPSRGSTIVLAILMIWFSVGCDQDDAYQIQFVKRIQEKGVYDRLVSWVDANISRDKLPKEDLQIEVGTPQKPVTYRAKTNFDWSILGMYPKSSSVFIECDENGEWGAVWLGNLRFAVIVALKPGWTGKSNEFIYRDRRITVYCSKD
jgi:hypothetical protein